MENTPDGFCGTFYAAKLLGVSVGTVQGLVEKGQLQAWKTKGGHRRISMQSIRDYQQEKGIPEVTEHTAELRVLVVDDDLPTLEAIKSHFEKWEFPLDLTVMTSAMEAMIDIGSLKPDLLLTDLKMPGVDGFELLRTLRNNPGFSSMILAAMTGMSAREIQERGGLPRSTIVMKKPLDMNWLNGFATGLVAGKRTSK